MTVRLLVKYGNYPKNTNLTTGAAEEARLLRTGQADTNTDLGTGYVSAAPTRYADPVSAVVTGSGLTQSVGLKAAGQQFTPLSVGPVDSATTMTTSRAVEIKTAKYERPSGIGVPMWDFSTLTGYSVTGAAVMTLVDSPDTSAKLGKSVAKSIQVVIPAGAGNNELNFPVLATPVQNPNSSFIVVIEQVGGASGEVANVYLGTAGFAAFFLYNYTFQGDAYPQAVMIGSDAPVGAPTPTFSTVTTGKIRLNQAAGGPQTFIVHGIFASPNRTASASFMHDDGTVSAFTEFVPLLNKYGWKAGFSIIGSLIDVNPLYMKSWQLARLYADGHDLPPHGATNLSTITLGAALADILSNSKYLTDLGYTRGSNMYVYPNGVYQHSATDKTSIQNYLASLGIRVGMAVAPNGPFHLAGGVNNLRLSRYAINAATVEADLLDDLDVAIDAGFSVQFMVHQIVASGAAGDQVNRADLASIMAAVRTRELAGSLRVLSPTEQMGSLGAFY